MVWYGKFLPPVTPTQNQSSAFSFELLKLLVDLSYTETFFRFAVIKAVGCKGKPVHLYLLENFNFIESIRSLFHASENAKVVPLELIVVVCASEPYCK